MRPFGSTLPLLLLAPAWLIAQPAQQPDAQAAKLEEVLTQWEKAAAGLNSMTATCNRITISKAFSTPVKYSGELKLVRPKNPMGLWRGSLELVKDGRPDDFDKIIWTGKEICTFDSANKTIRVFDQPEQQQLKNVADGIGRWLAGIFSANLFVENLFLDIKKTDIKDRYHITYVPPTDKWYYYLKIVPKTDQDRKTFKEARVALNGSNFLLRQLWFLQANDDEVTWDFPKMTPNADVPERDLAVPQPPIGWKLERMKKSSV